MNDKIRLIGKKDRIIIELNRIIDNIEQKKASCIENDTIDDLKTIREWIQEQL